MSVGPQPEKKATKLVDPNELAEGSFARTLREWQQSGSSLPFGKWLAEEIHYGFRKVDPTDAVTPMPSATPNGPTGFEQLGPMVEQFWQMDKELEKEKREEANPSPTPGLLELDLDALRITREQLFGTPAPSPTPATAAPQPTPYLPPLKGLTPKEGIVPENRSPREETILEDYLRRHPLGRPDNNR
jgi:hypothetical protein